MVDGAAIRSIVAWGPGDVVTSLYLDVDGLRSPRRSDVERRADSLFRAARERARRGEAGPEDQVEAELAEMGRWLQGELDRRATRGVALFARAATGGFAALPLPVSVHDQVVVDRGPDVAQLCLALVAGPPALVVLADSQRARLWAWEGGDLQPLDTIDDDLPRRVDVDIELAGFGHHYEELVREHHRRVGRRVAEALEQRSYRYVVVAGPGTSPAQLEAHLPERVVTRIADRLQLPVEAAPRDVAAAVATAVDQAERRRKASLVDTVRDRAATGTSAVAGLEATLDALGAGQVDTLVVEEQFESPGARCAACGLLTVRAGPCTRCGGPVELLANVVDAAVTDAFLHGVTLEPVDEGSAPDLGRIGALLARWAGSEGGGAGGA